MANGSYMGFGPRPERVKLESSDDLIVKTKSAKYNKAVNLPTQTIVHKPHEKTIRKKIAPTEKKIMMM